MPARPSRSFSTSSPSRPPSSPLRQIHLLHGRRLSHFRPSLGHPPSQNTTSSKSPLSLAPVALPAYQHPPPHPLGEGPLPASAAPAVAPPHLPSPPLPPLHLNHRFVAELNRSPPRPPFPYAHRMDPSPQRLPPVPPTPIITDLLPYW